MKESKRPLSKFIAIFLMACLVFSLAIIVSSADVTADATFEFGNNGTASHNDGSEKSSYSENNGGYTLNITGGSKMYTGARDQKGNSCIKLGTGSAAGKFSFTVPAEVTKVEIYVAKYKSNTSKITINGTTTTLTKNSNDGNYDVITVDTSSTKTVSVTTVSGGYRAMVNTIKFYKAAASCEHDYQVTNTVDATCTTQGTVTKVCSKCSDEQTETVAALGHSYETTTVPSTCTQQGTVTKKCSTCGDEQVTYSELAPHEFVNKVCTGCGISASTATFVDFNGDTVGEESGLSITIPELIPGCPEGWTFAGWSTTTFDETKTLPALLVAGNSVTLTDDTTYYAVYSKSSGTGSANYVKKEITEISSTDVIVITMTYKDGTVYALTNGNGTSKAPVATKVTVSNNAISGEVADGIKWNISYDNGNIIIYPNGDTTKWLYCTSANDGVRVGTNANNVFTIDSSSGYLKNTATSRYVGVYRTNPDWRCYTNTTGNTADQTLAFYVNAKEMVYSTNFEPSGSEPSGCPHESTTTTSNPATCTEDGYDVITCDECGEVVETIKTSDKLGHNYTEETTVAPTCTTVGIKTFTCENCSDSYTEEIAKLSHDYNEETHKCTMCGKTDPKHMDYVGMFYIATIRNGKYWYMTSNLGTASTQRYQATDSGLTVLPELIDNPAQECVFVFEKNGDGTYKIRANISDEARYLGWNSGNSGILVTEANAKNFTLTVNDDETVSFSFVDGSSTRYLSLNNTSGNNYFAFYTGTQIDKLSLIPLPPCQHTNKVAIGEAEDATCTEAGITAGVKCADCSFVIEAQAVINALGHDWDAGVQYSAATCTQKEQVKYTCQRCSESKIVEEGNMLSHNWVNNKCDGGCGLELVGKYYIATNRGSGNYFYMTSDLGANNRFQASEGSDMLPAEIYTQTPDAEKTFVLVKIVIDRVEYFYMYAEGVTAGENYLTATAGNDVAYTTLESALALTVDSTNVIYNIHFTAADGERYLALHNTSGNDYFSWYKSGKLNLSLLSVVDQMPTPKVYSASLRLGSDLAMIYTVKSAYLDGAYTMKFTIGATSVIVTEWVQRENGVYEFIFEGIGPHQLTDNIVAEFLVAGEVKSTSDNYSVETYLYSTKENYAGETKLLNLIDSVLAYGIASDDYVNKNGEVEKLDGSISEDVDKFTYDNKAEFGFTAVGVNFDVTNRIYVKLYINPELEAIVKIGDTVVTDMQSLGNGHYKFYTEGIDATDFNDVFTFTITVGEETATLTYSVYSYAYEKQNDANNYMANLAIALYNYGKYAEEYLAYLKGENA